VAHAASTSCEVLYTDSGCTTGVLPANSRYHAMYFEVSAYSADAIECRVYDRTNNQVVGRLTSTNRTVSKVIRGLYGSYWLGCGNVGAVSGSGEGKMNNSDLYTH